MVKVLHHLEENDFPSEGLDQARATELFSFMGDHEPEPMDAQTVMQIGFEAVLKTKHSEDVGKAAVKELTNIIKYKTWKYLKHVDDREPPYTRRSCPARCSSRINAMQMEP